jgi:hypothetical protein
MSVKSTLFKTALALGGAYLLYKGYQFGKVIYAEAMEELEKEKAAAGGKPLEKVIGEAVSDSASAVRDAGRTVRDNANTVIDAAGQAASSLQDVVKNAAAHVVTQALDETHRPGDTANPGLSEGSTETPRFDAAAPESQEAAGGADPAAGPAEGADGSQLPPVKD